MQAVSVGEAAGGTLVLVLRGEIDYTIAERVAVVMCDAVADRSPPAVCVDVTAVSFLDSSGVGVLVQAMQAAEAVGARFSVQNPNDKVFDQLQISGLLDLFGLADAEPDASGSAGPTTG